MNLCSVAAALVLAYSAPAATVTNTFGFTGPEIFPIDQQIGLLHVADLDGDGLNDIIVANDLRSKINLLYNQTGKTNRANAAPDQKLDLNELPPGSRFRIDSIPVDERLAALAVTDLNGDGRPDLVYFG
ncbi:MAG TPA: VCBS repeat-containing protein, partial [Candidatus Acidoferrales bacterium]|nr:VCBS repeat-containing protein [Candidatus Acidoferrales bacterium]